MISKKYQKFLDEYLVDFNATQAAIRVGYKEDYAGITANKILNKPEVKEELEKRFAESRVSSSQVIARLDAMAEGKIPTKIVTGSHARKEYDHKAAADSLAKVYALFQDKIELNISHLNITDEQDA